jgi:hypothetical protein
VTFSDSIEPVQLLYQKSRALVLRGEETLCSEYSPAAIGKLILKRLEYIRCHALCVG